jgi:RNA-binding protein
VAVVQSPAAKVRVKSCDLQEDEFRMLKSSDRRHLRGLAHHLKPVVQVGKQGLIENLIATVSQALDAHELIKVKFVDLKQQREELSREIATRTRSELAGLVGNIAILYRQHSDAAKRKIRLPQRVR